MPRQMPPPTSCCLHEPDSATSVSSSGSSSTTSRILSPVGFIFLPFLEFIERAGFSHEGVETFIPAEVNGSLRNAGLPLLPIGVAQRSQPFELAAGHPDGAQDMHDGGGESQEGGDLDG